MKKILFFSTAVLLLAFGLAKKYDFQFMLKPDRQYVQTLASSNAITQTIQGQKMTMNNTVKAVTQLSLKEKNNSGATYNATYKELLIGLSMMGQTQEFSSNPQKADSLDRMSQIMSKVVDKDFTVDISTSGEVSNVRGLQEILETATDEYRDEMGSDQLKEQLMMGIGDKGVINNLETTTSILPDKAVSPGETWTKDISSNSGFPVNIAAEFTLKSVENGIANIDIKATINTNKDMAKTEVQGMQASYSLSGSRHGSLMVEVETGWTTSGSFTDSIAGYIDIAPNMQVPEGMKVPINSVSKTTVETDVK